VRARLWTPLLLGAIYTVAAVWWTWPLAASPAAGYVFPRPEVPAQSRADAFLITWMMAWSGHALRTSPLHLFDANIWYPIAHAMCFSEHMIGAALQVLPLQLAGVDPVTTHNVFLFASFVVGALGAALVVRDLGGGPLGAFVAGALYGFWPNRSGLVGHVHMIGTHLVPFVLLYLQRTLRTGRWRDGVVFTVVLLLQLLTSVYHLYYFGIGVAVFIVAWALAGPPVARGAYARLALLLGVAGLVILPTMLPYLDMRERFAFTRDEVQTIWFSSIGIHYIGSLLAPIAHYRARFLGEGFAPSVLGLGALAAIVVGVCAGAPAERGGRRMTVVWLATALGLTVLALGPLMRLGGIMSAGLPGPYVLLERYLPGFAGLRAPGRAAIPAFCAYAVLAGLGVDAVVRAVHGPVARALCAALALVVVATEVWPAAPLYLLPLPWGKEPDGVYDWLAREPPDVAIVELPIGRADLDAGYMVRSARHWKPMVNGYTGFGPVGGYLRSIFYPFPDAASLKLMRDLGVRYAILHEADLPAPRKRLCAEVAIGRYPDLVLRWNGPGVCAVQVLPAPPGPPRPPDRAVPRSAFTLAASNGVDPRAAADGDVTTHWIDDVDDKQDAWLQVDLATPRRLRRVTIRLGSHFGEFLRLYRIEASDDGATWSTVLAPGYGEAPLVGMKTHPDDLAVDIVLPDVTTRHLRIVRPKRVAPSAFDIWANWSRWGVHEIELYEAPDGS
jgi:hypothetical protein